jgi:hypothetical protein
MKGHKHFTCKGKKLYLDKPHYFDMTRLLRLFLITLMVELVSCQLSGNQPDRVSVPDSIFQQGSYAYDRNFLQRYQPVIELVSADNPDAKVAVIGAYQGRVMTSTAAGDSGASFGWINYSLIASGAYQRHYNAHGGEERIWLAPEGGQFSIFFPKGKPFTFDNWQTPAQIDTMAFETVYAGKSEALFRKDAELDNYSGTHFLIRLSRKVRVLDRKETAQKLGFSLPGGVNCVAFETVNTLINRGNDWTKTEGTLAIWILGMYPPAGKTLMIAPFTRQRTSQVQVTDTYFGKVPNERLWEVDSAFIFKGDGKYRSKIGIGPFSARPLAGAYDPEKGTLTIIQYDLEPRGEYLKSTWEHHDDPYGGDAFNAYNDGPTADGSQLGPFIELESTSATRALRQGDSIVHHHRTFHFQGGKSELDTLAKKILGIDADKIER